MPYRKFKADYIFTGTELLPSNNILITDEKGIIEDTVDETDAGENIEVFKGFLSPGFINCHCHLELSHMKNLVESGTGLVDFLIKVVTKRSAIKEEIDAAIKLSDEEMYNAGIVAVGDICNTTDSLKIKQQSKIQYYNFIEVLGFLEDPTTRFSFYKNIYDQFCKTGFSSNTSIVPHAPYTVSNNMFKLINEISGGKIISIHNQECLAEDELYKTKTGDFLQLYNHLNINISFFQPLKKTSLQSYLTLINKPKTLLLVHNTFSTKEDVDFATKQTNHTNQQLYWCLCPNANLYIENKLPPVELLMQNNCRIVLGTDSYSSNRSLNILDEIKTLQKNFPRLSLYKLLNWATLNGAKALGLDDTFGSFTKGKKPGILVIDGIGKQKLEISASVSRIL